MSLTSIFQITIAILGLGVIATWIFRKKKIPPGPLGYLFSFAINIALPSLIFSSIIRRFSTPISVAWWQLPLWFVVFTIIALGITLATQYISRKESRREFAISLFFQNAMFYPLVILNLMFGDASQYVTYLVLFAFLQPSIVFSTYMLFFRKKDTRFRLMRVFNPVLIASFLALAIGLIGLQVFLPDWLIIALEIIGAVATPVLLLILVSHIYNDLKGKSNSRRQILIGEIIKFVLVKNLLFPLVFLGILLLIRPEYSIALILLLQGAAPPVSSVPVLTERSGGNRHITDQFIVASFLASVVSIPLIIYLFNLFFHAAQ